ncbi:MAG: hypothetical protein LBP73_03930 [Clostridiales Family XIII bacterium]|nr:hypothetical protein [Clostridiales Family XIII bacterium]
MRELITARLNEMRGSEDKSLLKEVLEEVFLALYDETERKYAALEQRIRDELPRIHAPFAIHTTVLPRGQIDAGHPYLSPMLPEESVAPELSANAIITALHDKEQATLETVFVEADYLKCLRLTRERPIFDGSLYAGAQRYDFKFRLEPAGRYNALIEKLCAVFLRNGAPWTTAPGAYTSKFFDVRPAEIAGLPPSGAKIRDIELDFGAYKDAIRRGLVPVWNIDKHRARGDDYPKPARDKINYEFRFDTRGLGADNGYLADYDGARILSVRREGGDIIAVSPESKSPAWDLYRLRPRRDRRVDEYPLPVLSNVRGDAFATRLLAAGGAHIATRAELKRVLGSFEVSEYVALADLRFTGANFAGETYDMNPFIRDEIRDPAHRKSLVLVFKAKNKDFFLNRDIVSFLVSELQRTYPEYNCVGSLL